MEPDPNVITISSRRSRRATGRCHALLRFGHEHLLCDDSIRGNSLSLPFHHPLHPAVRRVVDVDAVLTARDSIPHCARITIHPTAAHSTAASTRESTAASARESTAASARESTAASGETTTSLCDATAGEAYRWLRSSAAATGESSAGAAFHSRPLATTAGEATGRLGECRAARARESAAATGTAVYSHAVTAAAGEPAAATGESAATALGREGDGSNNRRAATTLRNGIHGNATATRWRERTVSRKKGIHRIAVALLPPPLRSNCAGVCVGSRTMMNPRRKHKAIHLIRMASPQILGGLTH